MKKILKMLVLGLLSAALLCCALPSAFAAELRMHRSTPLVWMPWAAPALLLPLPPT